MSGNLALYFLTVNYYSVSLIRRLLDSIENLAIPYHVIVVNNSPTDGEVKNLDYSYLEIIETGSNLGFGCACNRGLELIFKRSSGATVWLINPDAYFLPEDLTKIPHTLITIKSFPIVGTVIYNQEQNLTFSGGNFHHFSGTITAETKLFEKPIKPTSWVSGCSMILNLSCFKECPQFDKDFFLYYEDFEFCQRYNKLGYQVVICSQIKVIHQTSSITKQMKEEKITQEIYSYLLALTKQGITVGLVYRLIRICLVSIGQLVNHPKQAAAKLKGVKQFLAQQGKHQC